MTVLSVAHTLLMRSIHFCSYQPCASSQGYAVGNGVTDDEVDGNAIIPFAYGKALLSTELYTDTVQECQGNFWNVTKGELCTQIFPVSEEALLGLR